MFPLLEGSCLEPPGSVRGRIALEWTVIKYHSPYCSCHRGAAWVGTGQFLWRSGEQLMDTLIQSIRKGGGTFLLLLKTHAHEETPSRIPTHLIDLRCWERCFKSCSSSSFSSQAHHQIISTRQCGTYILVQRPAFRQHEEHKSPFDDSPLFLQRMCVCFSLSSFCCCPFR